MLDQVTRVQPSPSPAVHAYSGPVDSLTDSVGDVSDTHALVIGEHTLELVCRLIQRGCVAASTLRWHEKAESATVDLVVVPAMPDAALTHEVVAQARRALLPNGRVVFQLGDAPGGASAAMVCDLLRRHGFSAIVVTTLAIGCLVEAEVPFFGFGLHS